MSSIKIYTYLIILSQLIFMACQKDAPSDIQNEAYVKNFGGINNDEAKDFIQHENNLYLIGNLISNEGSSQIMMVKTDAFGNRVWQSEFAIGETCEAEQVIKLNQQAGFAIIGSTLSNQSDQFYDLLLLLVDDEGSLTDTIVFDFQTSEKGRCLVELEDGSLILLGVSAPNTTTAINQRLLIKTDNTGRNVLIHHLKPATELYAITPATSGNFYAAFTNNNKAQIALINSNGSDSHTEIELAATLTYLTVDSNNQLFACGTASNGTNGRNDILIAALTYNELNGNFIVDWQKNLGSSQNDQGNHLSLTENGTLLCTGSVQNPQLNTSDMTVFEVDQNGTVLKEKRIGGSNNEFGIKSLESGDQIIILSTTVFTNTSMISITKFSFE
ncbi:MAG: hypothetical protein AB7E36_07255 [Salinivirgaceae bacterium]